MSSFPASLNIAPIASATGVVALPGSKSISNRALLLAALADGETLVSNLLEADDTRVMREALSTLGVELVQQPGGLLVRGCGGRLPVTAAELFLGNAGTAFRSLTAALAFAGGRYVLDGVARMRERPIADLVDALNALGANISYRGKRGYPPLLIEPASALTTDCVQVKSDVSSQFISGLLMAAPLAARELGLRVEPSGALISQPYVDLTLAVMKSFGAEATREASGWRVRRQRYTAPGHYAVEGDASSASYFLALGAIAGGPVRVQGVGAASIQGDVRFADALERMGARISRGDDWIEARAPSDVLRAIELDCTDIPDAAMTLAIVALFADGHSTLRGIGSWRVKETDRIAAMATELRKLGASVDSGSDWISVARPRTWRQAEIDTYDDHRIAMCFSLAAAGGQPITIRDPGCVAKTFPDYFERLATLVGNQAARREPNLAQARS